MYEISLKNILQVWMNVWRKSMHLFLVGGHNGFMSLDDAWRLRDACMDDMSVHDSCMICHFTMHAWYVTSRCMHDMLLRDACITEASRGVQLNSNEKIKIFYKINAYFYPTFSCNYYFCFHTLYMHTFALHLQCIFIGR